MTSIYPSVGAVGMSPPRVSWPQIAGFFDGEGNIAMKRTGRGAARTAYWRVAQNETAILYHIHEFLRGFGCKGGVSGCELWLSRRQDILLVLSKTIPYLHVKHDIALDFYRYLMEVEKLVGRHGVRYADQGFSRPAMPLNARERRVA